MKVKDKYELLKKEYTDTLVIIKVGNFYTTFGSDAFILHYLFSYQITNDKLGFPACALEKVVWDLKNKSINYLVVSDEVLSENSYEDNQYYPVLEVAQKFYYEKVSIDMLVDRIRFLIHKDYGNYLKIKEFIDGI